MFAYEEAQFHEKNGNDAKAISYLEKSYEIYTNVIESHKTEKAQVPEIPAHWYKNVGIIHPKLVSIGMFFYLTLRVDCG